MAKATRRIFETISDTYTSSGSIGNGAIGTVFEVKNLAGETFALKLFTSHIDSTEIRKRFANELHFVSRSRHRNVVNAIDSGFVSEEGKKLPFYVMPRYDKTLRKLIDDGIPTEKIVPYFTQILHGVHHLHQQHCWHRDLKPENILYDDSLDTLLIADFGAAHFAEEELHTIVETKPTSRLANFRYSAPEQRATGQLSDPKADIFSLGLILNEMFTGEVIQGQGHTAIETIDPDYRELDELVVSMVQQNPVNRPSSIGEILTELKARGFEWNDVGAKSGDDPEKNGDDGPGLVSVASLKSRRAVVAVQTGTQGVSALRTYLDNVIFQLRGYDFPSTVKQLTDQDVADKVYEITPLRNEVADVLIAVNRYRDDSGYYDAVHEFFQRLILFMQFRDEGDSQSSWAADHFKIFASEIFLYWIASALKWNKFEQLNEFTEVDYYVKPSRFSYPNQVMQPFYVFASYSEGLEYHKRRTNSRLYSIQGDFLTRRLAENNIELDDLLQADFFLYLLYNIDRNSESHRIKSGLHWYPRLAPYMSHRLSPFEVFAKSQSSRYFDRFRTSMRGIDKTQLEELLDKLTSERQNIFYDGVGLNLKTLSNVALIGVAA